MGKTPPLTRRHPFIPPFKEWAFRVQDSVRPVAGFHPFAIANDEPRDVHATSGASPV